MNFFLFSRENYSKKLHPHFLPYHIPGRRYSPSNFASALEIICEAPNEKKTNFKCAENTKGFYLIEMGVCFLM